MEFDEKLNDNWEKDLRHSFDEPDVTKLRNKLKNIGKLSDERFSNYSMNTCAHEGTLN
jgi:hypothetical protein